MKYVIKPTNKFQKDIKRIQKRGLVYEIYEEELYLYLTRTGTHSDLFYAGSIFMKPADRKGLLDGEPNLS